jgi:hypothetical protein
VDTRKRSDWSLGRRRSGRADLPIRIRDAEDYDKHWDHIHQNPVKRGLVEHAIEYRCSSAYPEFKLDEQTSAAKAEVG